MKYLKRKLIPGLLLSLALIASIVTIPHTTVSASYASDNVLLEYDFTGYKGGNISATGNGVTVTKLGNSASTNKLFATTKNGNTYMYSSYEKFMEAKESGAASSSSTWANMGLQFNFDANLANEGKYAISFDVSRGNLEESIPEDKVFMVKMTEKDDELRILAADIATGKFYGYKGVMATEIDTTGIYGGPLNYEKNKIYRVDIVFDIDNNKVRAYIDGQLLTTRREIRKLAGRTLQLRLDQSTPYVDNLKVARVTDDSFRAEVACENNIAKIKFTETLSKELTPQDITVRNMTTGSAVSVAEFKKLSRNEVALTFAEGALQSGSAYSVNFSSDVKNFEGKSPESEIFALPGEEKAVYMEDFEEFTDDSIVLDGFSKMNYNDKFFLLHKSNWTTNPFKSVQAVADGTDDKAIRITRGTRSSMTASDVRAKLPHKVYFRGKVSFEYRIKTSEDLTSFTTYLISSANAQSYQISASLSIPSIRFDGNKARYSTNSTRHDGTYDALKNPVDEDRTNSAFHTYKVVYNFENNTADVYFDGEELATGIGITNFNKVSKNGYFDLIDMRLSGPDNTSFVEIDYVKVTQACSEPYIEKVTYTDYNGKTVPGTQAGIKTIKVNFAGNIDSASVANKITLTKGNAPVPFTGEFSDSDCSYTLTLADLLEGNSDYVLSVSDGVKDTYNTFVAAKSFPISTEDGAIEVPTAKFSIGENTVVKANLVAGDKVLVTATVIDTKPLKDSAKLVAVCYNGKKMSLAKFATVTWNGCIGTMSAELDVESIEDLEIKAFTFVDAISFKPIQSPFVLE